MQIDIAAQHCLIVTPPQSLSATRRLYDVAAALNKHLQASNHFNKQQEMSPIIQHKLLLEREQHQPYTVTATCVAKCQAMVFVHNPYNCTLPPFATVSTSPKRSCVESSAPRQ
jgi:hypothetical protein